MKKTGITMLTFLMISTLLGAQDFIPKGKVIEGQSVDSKLLKSDIKYSIYLPPDYDYSDRSYPVVYLLHGYSDHETAWVQFGEVNESADRAIADRKIPPMIIVMPYGELCWYVNDVKSKYPYEDAIFNEFIPAIEKKYRIRGEKEFRAVSGLSMGGYGSLIWALHHPDMFTACVPYSAGVLTEKEIIEMDEEQYDNWFKDIFGGNNQRLSEHWKKNSVLDLMENLPVDQIEQVSFLIDCGDDDFLFRGNSELHLLMRERGISHEYRVKNGSHNWTYWRTNITEGLIFIGNKFHR